VSATDAVVQRQQKKVELANHAIVLTTRLRLSTQGGGVPIRRKFGVNIGEE